MNKLIKPKALQGGDTVALISISGGRAGDTDMLPRYHIGKARLKDLFGINVIDCPNSLKGSDYLYKHPKARAEDLMWALQNTQIKGIIANMGGDDSYRVIPYVDLKLIHDNPKVFMGYSDIASWTTCFAVAGVVSFYGPNVLTPIAQPGKLDDYTYKSIQKTLFSTEIIGNVEPCKVHTPIEWKEKSEDKIIWTNNTGYKILQGRGKVQGRLFGGCAAPMRQIMGLSIFPKEDFFEDSVLFLEIGSQYNSLLAGLHELRALDAAGMFRKAKGLITGTLTDEEEKMLLKFIKYEARREDMPILTNIDFIHRTPMTVIPVGLMAEINCESARFSILEAGVC